MSKVMYPLNELRRWEDNTVRRFLSRGKNRIDRDVGEIFSLWLGGRRSNYVSSHALLNELCDERRFVKKVGGALAELRNGVHDGLFVSASAYRRSAYC